MASRNISVRLEEELLQTLESEAKERKVTLSEVVRDRLLASYEEPTPSGDAADVSTQVQALHLAMSRGFEAVFKAVSSPQEFPLDEAITFARTKLRDGL